MEVAVIDGDAHCLLDEAIFLEGVGIGEGADEGAVDILLGAGERKYKAGFHLDRRWAQLRRDGGVNVFGAIHARIGLSRTAVSFCLFVCTLLLARREWLDEFAVDEEVVEDAAWTPGNAVSPAFDAGCALLVDEDGAAADEVRAFAIMRSSQDGIKIALKDGFEKDEGLACVCDVAAPCGSQTNDGRHSADGARKGAVGHCPRSEGAGRIV